MYKCEIRNQHTCLPTESFESEFNERTKVTNIRT